MRKLKRDPRTDPAAGDLVGSDWHVRQVVRVTHEDTYGTARESRTTYVHWRWASPRNRVNKLKLLSWIRWAKGKAVIKVGGVSVSDPSVHEIVES